MKHLLLTFTSQQEPTEDELSTWVGPLAPFVQGRVDQTVLEYRKAVERLGNRLGWLATVVGFVIPAAMAYVVVTVL